MFTVDKWQAHLSFSSLVERLEFLTLFVYFLDGESILEVTICYLRVLSPRMKGRVLRLCLLAGTLISTFALLRIFLLTIS
ncbi:hypothetical protein RHMOL_Rhmol13G0180100 [Rhododendron molle]|uniref:Uncharacterized protein n=1 Tax=Rhododendron molle TaxID=49168 RepID=A0ACC0L8E2_RHOML|nr:hypothetical protein RHMOL_Rhmol13G0180100 [Rhododendron molle]